MSLKRCYTCLIWAGLLFVIPTSNCAAQMGVDSGLGLRLQKANCNFNLGWWRSGAAPTGVLIRETGNLLTGIAPYVAPTIQAIGGLPGSGLTNPTSNVGSDSAGRDGDDFVVENYDPNFEPRQARLGKIEGRQNVLMAKLGIKDFKRQMALIQPQHQTQNGDTDGEDGLLNPTQP